MSLPRIIFDTTGINALEDRGLTAEPLMKRLECGFEVSLTAMSADEIIPRRHHNAGRRYLLDSDACCTRLTVSAPRTRSSGSLYPLTLGTRLGSIGLG